MTDGAKKGEEIIFYDSNTGKPLFVAPRGRSFEEFVKESSSHVSTSTTLVDHLLVCLHSSLQTLLAHKMITIIYLGMAFFQGRRGSLGQCPLFTEWRNRECGWYTFGK